MKGLSEEAKRELQLKINSLKDDIKILRKERYNPFMRNGKVDIDAYIEFVTEFNEFINHAPKPFEKIIDHDMRL